MLSIDFGVQIYLIINGYNIPKTNDRNKPIINYKNYNRTPNTLTTIFFKP